MGHFKGCFEGAKTFLTPKFKGQKSWGPLETSWEMAHYVVCPNQKNIMSLIFKISGALVFLCPFVTNCPQFYHFMFLFFYFFIVLTFNNDTCRKPREISQFGKKSAKVYHSLYSTTEQLQVALWTFMFFKLGLNNEKSIHTLPLKYFHLLSLPLYSLPLETLCLVSLVSLITKTKRIAGPFAITDTHTDKVS